MIGASTLGCPACGGTQLRTFYEVEKVPVHNSLLVETQEAARRFPTGNLQLAFCTTCGFIHNLAFDPGLLSYTSDYEDTQAYSPQFNRFADELARGLIDRYCLRGKDVVEIGCGKGDFLTLLCQLGNNRGLGFDPAYSPGASSPADPTQVRFLRELYSEASCDVPADLVCCRHTLEHLPDVALFLAMIRRCLERRPDTVVYFEVPDTERVLREEAFWDIYYEHCSYFTLGSLARLFQSCDFELVDLRKGFSDQYLMLEARPRTSRSSALSPWHPHVASDELAATAKLVERFGRRLTQRLSEWRAELDRARQARSKVVLWGGGSKAVGYLTSLGMDDAVGCVVDINPKKHGKFLPGTGHEIVAPEFLATYQPELIVLMNPVYSAEVADTLDALGVRGKLLAL